MNIAKAKEDFPKFIKILEERGYSQSTIEKYKWIIGRLFSEMQGPDVDMKNYFSLLCSKLSKGSLPEVKSYLGTFDLFVETGSFHRDSSSRNHFFETTSYTQLNSYYQSLVDLAIKKLRVKKRYADSTMSSIKSASSVFCLHFQNSGHPTFETVTTQQPVLDYFYDKGKLLHCNATRYYVSVFLNACCLTDSWCRKILSFLPPVREQEKLYDYLKPEENDKIETVLHESTLSLRDKAIGLIAYYAGLRSCDIVGLRLDDVDLSKGTLSLDKQQKTGEPLEVPLISIVMNAICEYVEKERPFVDDDHIFITETKPHKKMNAGSMDNVSRKIMDIAGIRMSEGRRGLHLFRHAFASDLVSKDVPIGVVSALLGHSSLSSVNSYLDADVEHLRACALDVSCYADKSLDYAKMAEYKSFAAPYLQKTTEELVGAGRMSSSAHKMLCSIDEYCLSHQPQQKLDQGVLDDWAKPHEGETRKHYMSRMLERDVVNESLAHYGLEIHIASPPEKRYKNSLAKNFVSNCKELFDDYVAYRKASLRWNQSYEYELRLFDQYCHEAIPGASVPSQLVIDTWSVPKQTERIASCGKRVAFLSGLCQYANNTRGTSLVPPDIPTNDRTVHIPHVFDATELRNFFIACDNIERRHMSRETLFRTIVVPAIFRLIYSSGLRTKEARQLDRSDVDLVHGVINIKKSKGYKEHRVALHASMLEYLKQYDSVINGLIPDRGPFFPNEYNNCYSSAWMDTNFDNMWYRFNGGHAVPYDFRHHYAITNINSWHADAGTFNKNLVYLSRSMGHSTLESTMYYYSYTQNMARQIMTHKTSSFDAAVPSPLNDDEYED